MSSCHLFPHHSQGMLCNVNSCVWHPGLQSQMGCQIKRFIYSNRFCSSCPRMLWGQSVSETLCEKIAEWRRVFVCTGTSGKKEIGSSGSEGACRHVRSVLKWSQMSQSTTTIQNPTNLYIYKFDTFWHQDIAFTSMDMQGNSSSESFYFFVMQAVLALGAVQTKQNKPFHWVVGGIHNMAEPPPGLPANCHVTTCSLAARLCQQGSGNHYKMVGCCVLLYMDVHGCYRLLLYITCCYMLLLYIIYLLLCYDMYYICMYLRCLVLFCSAFTCVLRRQGPAILYWENM